jgi:multidrug resistance protein, MATE family
LEMQNTGARARGRGRLDWRHEIRELLKLAGPMVATQLAQMIILTTDVVMLGRLSTEALAGAALGNTIYFFAWQLGMGPATAVSPMIAHIVGGRPNDRAGMRAVTRMALWAMLLMTLPLAAVLLFARDILVLLGQDPVLAAAAGVFVLPLCLGLPLSLGFQVLRNFATALGRPHAPMWVMAVSIPLNALFDYMLIFGHFGAPRLGLLGSGIASTCSFAFGFLAMTAIVLVTPRLGAIRVFRRFSRPDWSKFAELFRLGIPIGMTMIFEGMLFMSATLLMGTFGANAVAAHQIALNVSSLTFMVPLGVAMAAMVRIGLAAGAGDSAGVRRAGFTALALSTGFMSLCGAFIALFPGVLARLYLSGGDPVNAGAIALASSLLMVAAAYQIFDGIQVTSALILRGLKDANMPMWLTAGSYWLLGFPACIFLSRTCGLGGLGVWIGLAFALFLAAISLSVRFWLLSRAGAESH